MTYMTASQCKSSTPSHAIIQDLFSFTCPSFMKKPKDSNEVVYAELGNKPKNAPPVLPFELAPVIYTKITVKR